MQTHDLAQFSTHKIVKLELIGILAHGHIKAIRCGITRKNYNQTDGTRQTDSGERKTINLEETDRIHKQNKESKKAKKGTDIRPAHTPM